jgi:hypothetical protein
MDLPTPTGTNVECRIPNMGRVHGADGLGQTVDPVRVGNPVDSEPVPHSDRDTSLVFEH